MKTIIIDSLGCPGALPYTGLTGAQLKTAGSGAGLFIAESINVIRAALEAGYEPVSLLSEKKHIPRIESQLGAALGDTPIYTGEDALLERITGFALSRGVLAAMRRRPLPEPGEVIAGASRVALLEGIIDPTNVGAIFRSAAGLGMDAVLVSSNCCDPLHRRAARVSMGAVFRIKWAVLPCLKEDKNRADIGFLKERGFFTLAAALDEHALSVGDARLKALPRLAVALGSEGPGLKKETIDACDCSVMIPMRAGVDSLNAAAASAVLFWELAGKDVSE